MHYVILRKTKLAFELEFWEKLQRPKAQQWIKSNSEFFFLYLFQFLFCFFLCSSIPTTNGRISVLTQTVTTSGVSNWLVVCTLIDYFPSPPPETICFFTSSSQCRPFPKHSQVSNMFASIYLRTLRGSWSDVLNDYWRFFIFFSFFEPIDTRLILKPLTKMKLLFFSLLCIESLEPTRSAATGSTALCFMFMFRIHFALVCLQSYSEPHFFFSSHTHSSASLCPSRKRDALSTHPTPRRTSLAAAAADFLLLTSALFKFWSQLTGTRIAPPALL